MQQQLVTKENTTLEREDRNQRLIAMGQMAASLAHEIRNPLGSMELYCTLLKKDLKASNEASNSEALNMAEQIHQGIKTLDRIINNCLQFSRDISPKISNIANPQLWLEQIVNDVVVSNKADNISISINVASNCNICVDKFLMQQAIVNILVNAIDAVQAAKQKYPQDFEGKISINSYQDSIGKWHLCITDNGLGIKNEQLRKIFDPFFTTKEKGTGLGLAIVHSIVTAHGGSIEIQSIQEEETTIDITI